jgi:molybdopterin-containing oxidoreductase family iron-sulfur binding subunit
MESKDKKTPASVESSPFTVLNSASPGDSRPRETGNGKRETEVPDSICPGKLGKRELLEAREKLAGSTGPEYWRSLEELAGSEEFRRAVQREFPKGASEWLDPVSRRGFMKLMGASLALAGLTSCVQQPVEPIVPYVRQPEEVVLGVPLYYATAMTLNGYAYPQLVTSHEGRPTKIEGNPQHPGCLGGSDIFSQAAILGLYDPDRAETNLYQGEIQAWLSFLGALRAQVTGQRVLRGAGLRFLTPTVSSPTLAWQLRTILQAFPEAKWYQWEPVSRDFVRAGAQMAFGQYVEARYDLLEADIILCLDAEIFSPHFPGNHVYARQFAARRKADPSLVPITDVLNHPLPIRPMNRLYSLESTPGLVTAKSDHHLALPPSEIERYTRLIATRLGISAGGGQPRNSYEAKWIDGLIKDLQAHRGASAVIAGDTQPPVVHALAHAINEQLGNAGKTVIYTDPVEQNPVDQTAGLKELVADMKAGKVDLLIMSDVNPVYDAPADLDFLGALPKVAGKIYHGLYLNETAPYCDWFVLGTHYLEHWSDGRSFDGTTGIVQPLIAPMYGGKSMHEVLNAFTNNPDRSGYDTVRGYWRTQVPGSDTDFEGWWRRTVHDGFVANSTLPAKPVKVKLAALPPETPAGQGIELVLRPDPSVYDGRYANNGWLQELPKPMSKLTWDNALLVGPAMAKRLGLQYADVVEIQTPDGRKVTGAVWVHPGQSDNTAATCLGYGRTRAGRTGNGAGFDTYPLRTSTRPYAVPGVTLRKTGQQYKLITTQGAQDMENRHVVRAAALSQYKADPEFALRMEPEPSGPETLYPKYDYSQGYAWGMSIDLNACVGCNACIIACQAENNIPVVGKVEVSRGRHMHWLRVDSYYQGDPANPRVFFQPVPCMQCENAPCEVVCPVGATLHSTEGLNDMVYNRCVGTRYCSNNCPYKVRRFNFFLFQDWNTPQLKMARNPEVTVRSRGVMEKCTYCVQRITKGRIKAEEQDRQVRDYEIQTACQQACPAGAIVFGNINDRNSRVAKLKEQPLNYGLLADLNTRPRTTYQAMVFNPNPEIPEPTEQEG